MDDVHDDCRTERPIGGHLPGTISKDNSTQSSLAIGHTTGDWYQAENCFVVTRNQATLIPTIRKNLPGGVIAANLKLVRPRKLAPRTL